MNGNFCKNIGLQRFFIIFFFVFVFDEYRYINLSYLFEYKLCILIALHIIYQYERTSRFLKLKVELEFQRVKKGYRHFVHVIKKG